MTAWKAVTCALFAGIVGLCPAAVQARVHHRTAGSHHGSRVVHARASHVQKGRASIYASNLRGRNMADGTPFNPASNSAASKTLPLGTTARVTNLRNGRSTTVEVRDRGPYKAGRILDVSPGSAGALGMQRDGVAPVAITPLQQPASQ